MIMSEHEMEMMNLIKYTLLGRLRTEFSKSMIYVGFMDNGDILRITASKGEQIFTQIYVNPLISSISQYDYTDAIYNDFSMKLKRWIIRQW